MTLDPSTSAEPSAFDPASPIARFIQGVLDIFYGPDAGRVASDPTYLRGAIEALLDATRPLAFAERGPEAAQRLVQVAWETEDEGAIELALAALHAAPAGCPPLAASLAVRSAPQRLEWPPQATQHYGPALQRRRRTDCAAQHAGAQAPSSI